MPRELKSADRQKAIHQIERAAFSLHALDVVTSAQRSGDGIEWADYLVLMGEMLTQAMRRLDAASMLLGNGRLGILDDANIEISAANPVAFLRTRCVKDSLQEAK